MTARAGVTALLAAVLLLLTGCGVGDSAVRPPTARPVKAPGVPRIVSRDVAAIATSFQDAYSSSDLNGLSKDFQNASDADALLSSMRRWQGEGVERLHVSVIYLGRQGAGYVGTFEYWQDPHAIPAYSIYTFQQVRRKVRITGQATGLRGTSYKALSWAATRSAHFVVYHSPYQLRGGDRSGLADLEYQRAQFLKKFGVRLAPVALYYLFPRQELMGPLTHDACGSNRDNVGCAFPYAGPPVIMASIWPTFHEPIHVYEVSMEPKGYEAPLFIGEGTAVALEDRQVDPRLSDYCSDVRYIPLDVCAVQALRDVDPMTLLPDRGFKGAEAGDAYALGGSFVKYLILTRGYHRFRDFYYALAARPKDTVNDYDIASRAVYKRSIQSLVTAWTHDICPSGC